MKIRFSVLILLALCLVCAAAAGEQEFTGYYIKASQSETLAEGVTYSRYILGKTDSSDVFGQRINLVEVTREGQAHTRLEAVYSGMYIYKGFKQLTTLLRIARPRIDGTVLAAVNGDFFDTAAGGSMGHLKTPAGWLAAGEYPDSWACGMTAEGEPVIGQPGVELSVIMPDGSAVPIDALNGVRSDHLKSETAPEYVVDARKDNSLVLFTTEYGGKTHTQKRGTEVTLMPDGPLNGQTPVTATVQKVEIQKTKGGAFLKNGKMVLSGTGEAAERLQTLKKGDTVQISLIAKAPFDTAMTVMGGGRPDGGPLLLLNGVPQDLEHGKEISVDAEDFYKINPRTVFAIREDGSYFLLAVEGNRKGSYGMTLEETQVLLTDLGAYTAFNLDGGPSTTMAVRRNGRTKVVTDTTGGGGRQAVIGSALVLVQKDED